MVMGVKTDHRGVVNADIWVMPGYDGVCMNGYTPMPMQCTPAKANKYGQTPSTGIPCTPWSQPRRALEPYHNNEQIDQMSNLPYVQSLTPIKMMTPTKFSKRDDENQCPLSTVDEFFASPSSPMTPKSWRTADPWSPPPRINMSPRGVQRPLPLTPMVKELYNGNAKKILNFYD